MADVFGFMPTFAPGPSISRFGSTCGEGVGVVYGRDPTHGRIYSQRSKDESFSWDSMTSQEEQYWYAGARSSFLGHHVSTQW